MIEYVLDASAILAVVKRERGFQQVQLAADRSAMSTVNIAEVGSFMTKEGFKLDEVRTTLAAFPIEIIAFDKEQAMEAARLRPLTLRSGLSLGDRACLALAGLRGLTALTSERVWADLDLGVKVELIR